MIDFGKYHKPLWRSGEPFYGLTGLDRAVAAYSINDSPDYQRDHVWTTEQQEAFVGYVIQGGDTSALILNTGPLGDMEAAELVDGKQRLRAGLRWANGEIAAAMFDGSRIMRADVTEKRWINKLNLSIGLRFGLVGLTRAECLEYYLRMNSGGTVHTAAEIAKVRTLLENELRQEQVS